MYDDEECVYRACADFGGRVRRRLLFGSAEPDARQHDSARGSNLSYEQCVRSCDEDRYTRDLGSVGVE